MHSFLGWVTLFIYSGDFAQGMILMANSIRELVGCLLDGFRALLLELSKFRVNKSWKTMFHQHCCSRAEELEGFWGVLGHC